MCVCTRLVAVLICQKFRNPTLINYVRQNGTPLRAPKITLRAPSTEHRAPSTEHRHTPIYCTLHHQLCNIVSVCECECAFCPPPPPRRAPPLAMAASTSRPCALKTIVLRAATLASPSVRRSSVSPFPWHLSLLVPLTQEMTLGCPPVPSTH